MTQTLETLSSQVIDLKFVTDADILARLRQTHQIAEITTAAQQDKLVIEICNQLGNTVSDAELQTAGDKFRLTHQLSSAAKTLEWLAQQQITVEDWTQGIRISLLTQKLKETLFGDQIDAYYLQNRDHFRRVALSQILLSDALTAMRVFEALKSEPGSFCALTLEHSQTKYSQQQGGFVGIRFVAELMTEVAEAISDVVAGVTLPPVQTRLGYHILKIEKWFSAELNQDVRQTILDSLFQAWMKEIRVSGK